MDIGSSTSNSVGPNAGTILGTTDRGDSFYASHLIVALWQYGDQGLARIDAINRVWQLRMPTGLNMPKAFACTVQSSFNLHNSQSKVFWHWRRKPEDDLFFSVGGKGSGVWAVRREIAGPWLEIRAASLWPPRG